MPEATVPNAGMNQGMEAAPPKPNDEDHIPEGTDAATSKPNDEDHMPEGTDAATSKPGETRTAQAARPRRTRPTRRPRRYDDLGYPIDYDLPCGCKVLRFMCKSICNFLGSLLTVYLLWLVIFRPYKVHPHVDGAALTVFELAGPAPGGNATALRYDMALNISFFNSRFSYLIEFGHLTAGLYYNGTKIGPSDDTLPSFMLRTRRHRVVYPVLRGRASNVSDAVVESLARDRAEGRLNLDVRVKTTLTYRIWPSKATYYYEYDCWLLFAPPPGNGTPAFTGGFNCGRRK
uniref:Late embryogenesis abundant protein LEA-2 subgroup domain-containing protein n=1 Tax=Oryza brachyantha TaxID=4533 RepID=J3M4S7_ORYBR